MDTQSAFPVMIEVETKQPAINNPFGTHPRRLIGQYRRIIEYVQLKNHTCFVALYMRMLNPERRTMTEPTWESEFCQRVDSITEVENIDTPVVIFRGTGSI